MTPELRQFVDEVRHMRELQKRYFARREPAVLEASKAQEKRVDAMVKHLLGEEERRQGELFGGDHG